MDDAMRDLYDMQIMAHNKSPRNKGRLDGADRMQEGFNPLCGDRIVLSLRLQDGRIEDIRFDGHGCAIDTASASMMTEAVKGRPLDEVERLHQAFSHLVLRDGEADQAVLGKLSVFSGVGEFPARVKCATLPWHTLKAALEGQDETVSTE